MAKVRYEKEVTKAEVLAEADVIWKKCQARFTPDDTDKDLERLYDDMRTDHLQFAQAYPIVMRYMCNIKRYKRRALDRYLDYIVHHPWKNEDAYLESQATYVTMLFKETQPRFKPADARRIYDQTLRSLTEERKQFKKNQEIVTEHVKTEHSAMLRRNTIELKEWFSRYGEEALNVPVRVDADADLKETFDCVLEDIDDAVGGGF